ncbi:MAG: 50S ribosomal protein L9 [Spirochaetales bacterium]|nr:50S ribosomal protein L9 [Spirochaetales bacterium]
MRTTKIILNQDVYNLGEEGDICEVAPGYARNYLLPRGFAAAYSKKTVALLSQKREIIDKRKQEKQDAAKGLKDRLESMKIALEMPSGDTGRLFGSVTNATLAEYFAAEGETIERKKIMIPDHTIKMVGTSKVQVRLYADETAEVTVEVLPVGGKKEAAKKASAKAAAAKSEASEETQSEIAPAAGEPPAEDTAAGEPAAGEPAAPVPEEPDSAAEAPTPEE